MNYTMNSCTRAKKSKVSLKKKMMKKKSRSKNPGFDFTVNFFSGSDGHENKNLYTVRWPEHSNKLKVLSSKIPTIRQPI
jgi:hypothetical protein